MEDNFVFPPIPIESKDSGAVHYTADSGKSAAQKERARANIGALAADNPTATGTFTLGSTSMTEAQLQALLALIQNS